MSDEQQPIKYMTRSELMDQWKRDVETNQFDPVVMICMGEGDQAIIFSTYAHDSDEVSNILKQVLQITQIKKQFKEKGANYES